MNKKNLTSHLAVSNYCSNSKCWQPEAEKMEIQKIDWFAKND